MPKDGADRQGRSDGVGARSRKERRDRSTSQIENGPASRLAGIARVDFGKERIARANVERCGSRKMQAHAVVAKN